MKIQVIRELLCLKAEQNKEKGTVDCQGISEFISVNRFPTLVSFQLVVWLKGVTEKTNDFEASIWKANGELLGRNEQIHIAHLYEQFSYQSIPFIIRVNNGAFESKEDFYTIEIRSKGELLLYKKISAKLEPGIIPNTECGDQGIVHLDREG